MGYGFTFAIIFGAICSIGVIGQYSVYKETKKKSDKILLVSAIIGGMLGVVVAFILGNSI